MPVVPVLFFVGKDPVKNYRLLYSFVMSFYLLQSEAVSQSFLGFHDQTLLKITDQLCCRMYLSLGVSAISWRRRQRHPTPVLLPGKSRGWRSLVGCSPWGHKDLDTTERLPVHFSLSCIGEGNGNPLQCSCLENPRDGGAWWAAVYGVAQSRTRLKWLSSSSHFLKVGFRLCVSITQVKQCFSNCILSGGTQFQLVPLLTKFAFITWFSWCLPNFSTVKFISLGN